jgi:hypothetical protein
MAHKSSVAIALILDIDAPSVSEFIKSHSAGITTMDDKMAERKEKQAIIKPPKEPKPKKKKANKITSAKIVYAQIKRQVKRYADREQNFKTLIPVKIDHKTYIYIKPGVDPEMAKEKFLLSLVSSNNHNHYNPKIK